MLLEVLHDLQRPHTFAFERVGFIACSQAKVGSNEIMLFATRYEALLDDEYVDDDSAGAVFGPAAIGRGLRMALNNGGENITVLHVHHHFGSGVPRFSLLDKQEARNFVPDFFHAAPDVPHGAIVLSNNRAYGEIWLDEGSSPQPIYGIISVGVPTEFLHLV